MELKTVVASLLATVSVTGLAADDAALKEACARVSETALLRTIVDPSATAERYEVACDRENATYRCGEKATFTVTAFAKSRVLAGTGTVKVSLLDAGSATVAEETFDLAAANPFKISGTLAKPGFLRLHIGVNRKNSVNWSVAFDPLKIVQERPRPADFESFWRGQAERLEKEVPLDPRCEKDESRSRTDAACDWFRVSFATFGGKRVSGLMSVPRGADAEHKVPGRVRVPGAGVSLYNRIGLKRAKAASLCMTVFPFVSTLDQNANYKNLLAMNAELKKAFGREYPTAGICGKVEDQYYFPYVLGINRAVNWFAAQPFVDRRQFTYNGQSQGGGFGLMLLALNGNFTRGVISEPAITAHAMHLQGCADGWPGFYVGNTPEEKAAAERNAAYYDGVNFATLVKCPVRFVAGFADMTCPPHCVYAAYNACASSDKAIYDGIGVTHTTDCREVDRATLWEEVGTSGVSP